MWRRILNWALVGACVISVAGSALIIGATLHASLSDKTYIEITGGSMEPHIAQGDIIRLDPKGSIDVGSVITFAKDGKTTTHRVVKHWISHDSTGIQRTVYQTKGDANATNDPWVVTDGEILGVQSQIPALVRLSVPLIEKPFLIVLFSLPLLFFLLLNEVRNSYQLLKSRQTPVNRSKNIRSVLSTSQHLFD